MKILPLFLGIVAILLVITAFRATAEVSEAEAKAYLAKGAKVVDVRTAQEFQTQRLTNVINVPLADVRRQFPVQFTNKSEVILLHCRSGRRSGTAEQELRELGYTNVFNLGSFERAQRILGAAER